MANYNKASLKFSQTDPNCPEYQYSENGFNTYENLQDSQNNTTFRQIKYQEIYTPSCENLRRRNLFNTATSNIIDSLASISLTSRDVSPLADIPMEIDSSGNLSMNLTNEFEKYTEKEVSIQGTSKTILEQCSYCHVVFIAVIILLITLLIYLSAIGNVNKEIQLDNIKRDLNSVLYQTNAISIIIETFDSLSLWKKPVMVLPFIGSSGVGKTFTANILKRNFDSLSVHELNTYNLKNADQQQDISSRLSMSCCSLVIIEDLSIEDCTAVIDFIVNLPENCTVLVIPIFNIQTTADGWTFANHSDYYNTISKMFYDSGLYHKMVKFNVLKVKDLEEWLYQELNKRNIETGRHSQLMKSLLDVEELDRKGFKGINTKLLLALDNVY